MVRMTPSIHPTPPRDGGASYYKFLSLLAAFLVIFVLDTIRFTGEFLKSLNSANNKPYESLASARGAMQEKNIHPRVSCLVGIDGNGTSGCGILETDSINDESLPSIPNRQSNSGEGDGSTSDDPRSHNSLLSETEECKLSDPSYQAVPAAPSTCNDVHALGFRFGPAERADPSERGPMSGMGSYAYPSRHKVQYLTRGGFRSVWEVNFPGEMEDLKVIMKTNQLSRGWSSKYLDQNRRDVLVSERAGNSPALSNLLPIHQYCAFSSIVPFATAGVLEDYVPERLDRGDPLGAGEQYHLAMMAARGLYQAHLYSGGKATHAHADVKPPQFLLFQQSPRKNKNASTTVQSSVPVVQINDFNRGRFLTRSVGTNETCPFRMCDVTHMGSLYRSPEEYKKCADQSDSIDVFSLAGVFYYILSDGEKPWYYVGSYKKGVDAILRGKHPRLPGMNKYQSFGEGIVKKVRDRSKHPLVTALKDVMTKCWAFKPEDRPSSLQVVRMLEEKWREINPSTT